MPKFIEINKEIQSLEDWQKGYITDESPVYHYMIMWPMTMEQKIEYFLKNATLEWVNYNPLPTDKA